MKKTLCVLVAALILAGCGAHPSPQSEGRLRSRLEDYGQTGIVIASVVSANGVVTDSFCPRGSYEVLAWKSDQGGGLACMSDKIIVIKQPIT